MTVKKMWVSTGIYIFCTVVWTINFFLHWHQDEMLETSTVLFGVAAVCFGISSVLNLIRIARMKKEDK